jgi:hypothetical protein
MIVIDTLGIGVNAVIAGVAVWSLRDNHKQTREAQKQALEVQQDLHRPLIVPTTKIVLILNTGAPIKHPDWNADQQPLTIQNVGAGIATNIQCCLLGWDEHVTSGPPVGHRISRYIFDVDRPLSQDDDMKLTSRSSLTSAPLNKRIDGYVDGTRSTIEMVAPPDKSARLVITYQDIFQLKHASIFDYTVEGQWMHVAFLKTISQSLADLGMI